MNWKLAVQILLTVLPKIIDLILQAEENGGNGVQKHAYVKDQYSRTNNDLDETTIDRIIHAVVALLNVINK